jgi:hypothetical protein
MLAVFGSASLPDEGSAAGFVRAVLVGGVLCEVVEEFEATDCKERRIVEVLRRVLVRVDHAWVEGLE